MNILTNYNNKKNNMYISEDQLFIKGPLGNLNEFLPFLFIKSSSRLFISKEQYRFFENILKNSLQGVNLGWHKQLNVIGRGFKLFRYKSFVAFDLGYSNLFLFKGKNNILSMHATKHKVLLSSVDKSILGSLSSRIRGFYSLDKYHNKGIYDSSRDNSLFYKKLM